MTNHALTTIEVRDIIDQAGIGDSFTARLENLAGQIGISIPTMFRYLRKPPTRGAGRAVLLTLAYKYDVLDLPEDETGALST